MTAFSSIYSSMTGLVSFSTALNSIGNDVSNVNTPGYKASTVLFSDLGFMPRDAGNPHSEDQRYLVGQGVEVSGVIRRFSDGETQSTGNATDLAITGNGFFVLSKDGHQAYTRAGQFKFDNDGFLIDPVTLARVQAIDAAGNLSDLKLDRSQTSPPVATTKVTFSGNLSTGSTSGEVDNVSLVDASGSSQKVTFKFANNNTTTPGSWLVTVLNASSDTIGTGEIRFDGSGSPSAGFNTVSLTLTAGSQQSTVELNFGDPGSFSGTTSFSGGTQSTISASNVDGSLIGTLQNVTIDRQGLLQFTFSNGKTATGQQVALAYFSNPEGLVEIGHAQFAIPDSNSMHAHYGRATEDVFGTLVPGSIELANVSLSEEFSSIVILQRGFQGSSQVLNVSSKLIEDLYNSLSGKG